MNKQFQNLKHWQNPMTCDVVQLGEDGPKGRKDFYPHLWHRAGHEIDNPPIISEPKVHHLQIQAASDPS